MTEIQNSYCSVVDTNLAQYKDNPHGFNDGCILICKEGSATVSVNLDLYEIKHGSIFFLFPRDIFEVKERTNNFNATLLLLSGDLMGEASTRLEHFIFDKLHSYPLIEGDTKVQTFIHNVVENVQIFSDVKDNILLKDFAMLQTRSLFLMFTDYVKRNYGNDTPRTYSRLEEHFKVFMSILIKNYKMSREVSFYADKMNITPKYLNFIVQSVAHRTCKSLIDAYIIMQLKLELRNTEKAVQEVAYEYNFPNQSFLGSYFKKYVGVSPRAFRNDE